MLTSRSVPQHTAQMLSPRAGQNRFALRFWQIGQVNGFSPETSKRHSPLRFRWRELDFPVQIISHLASINQSPSGDVSQPRSEGKPFSEFPAALHPHGVSLSRAAFREHGCQLARRWTSGTLSFRKYPPPLKVNSQQFVLRVN